jgi:single-strand DNA-binding protein
MVVKVDETEWHNIVCWRGLADVADKFLKKSMQVYIEGKLKSRQWEDKEGNKRRTVEVVAENFKILTRNYSNSNISNGQNLNGNTSLDDFSADEFNIDTDSNLVDLSSNELNKKTTGDLPF